MTPTSVPAGLDYGTSNSLLSVWDGSRPVAVPLEDGDPRLPSVFFAERLELLEAARRQAGGEEALRALAGHPDLAYGLAALRRHFDAPEGFFVRSPKSFLASELQAEHLARFEQVIALFLAHLRRQAEAASGHGLRDVVLGRPVRFHVRQDEAGERQAVTLLERAARAAGFRHVAFLEEPVAAALDYERTLVGDRLVLVVDVGGGTTDCTVMRLGPSRRALDERRADVLACSGDRVGGMDIDIRLAWQAFMREFGRDAMLKDGLPFPHLLLHKSIAVNDVQAQADFFRAGPQLERLHAQTRDADRHRVDRLLQLCEARDTHRLVHAAEGAKIELSERDDCEVLLDRVRPTVRVSVGLPVLEEAARAATDRFAALVGEAVRQAGASPDVVYVTGGTARSPIVRRAITSAVGEVEVVVGDHFGSVASGLATWAGRLYR